MSSSRGSGARETSSAMAISSSVVLPRAESTATTRAPPSRRATMRAAARLMRCASATEVPPNFMTTSSDTPPGYPRTPRSLSRGRRAAPSRPDHPIEHRVYPGVPKSEPFTNRRRTMSATLQFDEDASRRVERIYTTPDVIEQRQTILRALALQPGERAIDIGSGPGLLAREMAVAVGTSGRICGVDVSESMLALARARRPPACSSAANCRGKSSRCPAIAFRQRLRSTRRGPGGGTGNASAGVAREQTVDPGKRGALPGARRGGAARPAVRTGPARGRRDRPARGRRRRPAKSRGTWERSARM